MSGRSSISGYSAIADYTEAIRLGLHDANVSFSRGLLWEYKENYDKAIADYTTAIRLELRSDAVYFHRGDCWLQKDEYDKAIADFDEVIRIALCDPGPFGSAAVPGD